MASTKRTWLWIIFGVIGFMALCLVALVGGGIYFVSRHVKTELVGQNAAEEQFLRQRERFAGQQPLVEVEGADKADVQARVRRAPESARSDPCPSRSRRADPSTSARVPCRSCPACALRRKLPR